MAGTVVITPGIDFILRGLIKYLVPNIALVFGLRRLSVPLHISVLAGVLAVPSYATFRVLYSDFKRRRQAERLGARVIPCVKGRRIGNIDVIADLNWHFDNGYLGDGVPEHIEKYGNTFNFHVLWDNDTVFTISPDHIKLVLATDFNNYEKGNRFTETMAPVLGTGVFNSDGSMWKFHRSMTRPFFSRDRISHFDLFDRHADHFIARIKERSRLGLAVDIQDLFGRFTLDSATEFLFGSCVQSLGGKLPVPYGMQDLEAEGNRGRGGVAQDFPIAFLRAQEAIAARERLGKIWPLWEMWGDKTKEPMKIVNAFVEPIIEEAVRKKRQRNLENGVTTRQGQGEKSGEPEDAEVGEDETLLDHLVKFTSDPVVLRDETLNIMLAGRDTTAATLTVLTYILATHSHVLSRLRAEVLAKVGPSQRPTYENIREMKYLRAVINEVLRLFPVVPFNVRQSINATVWPSPDPTKKPIYIPAHTKVMYSVFLMQRRKDLWGPDAEQFDPDRFLDDRLKKYLIPNSFAFLPFNAGPRICLGQQFAYNEISFMVIRLLQRFDSFTLDEVAQPPETRPRAYWKEAAGLRKSWERFYPRATLTLYAYGGMWIRAHEASSDSS